MRNKNICSTCKVGYDTCLLDRHGSFCPYLYCHNGKSCSKYKSLEKTNKAEDYSDNVSKIQ